MTQTLEPTNGELVRQEPARTRLIAVSDDSPFANLLDTGRFDHLWRVSCLFSKSALVPEHFRGHTEDCFIGVQMAIRLGVDPFMMLQNTYVVHGKPGMEAKLCIALINSSGLFVDPLDYEVVGTDPFAPDYKVRAFATRKSTGKLVQGTWVDWKTVRAEGWESKSGSKWKTIPALMFCYRAATFFGRLHCPERLMGMQTREELEDVGPKAVESHVVTEDAAARIARGKAALEAAKPGNGTPKPKEAERAEPVAPAPKREAKPDLDAHVAATEEEEDQSAESVNQDTGEVTPGIPDPCGVLWAIDFAQRCRPDDAPVAVGKQFNKSMIRKHPGKSWAELSRADHVAAIKSIDNGSFWNE